MTYKNRKTKARRGLRIVALGAIQAFAGSAASAAPPALSALGPSGGLVIPYGFTLPQGTFEGQYNDYIDPRFGGTATKADVAWAGIGILPYVEATGGLVNYTGNVRPVFPGAESIVVRHLMANLKVAVPKWFRYQPDIAVGIDDIGGQTHFFRSTYGVVSQVLGPATLTLGYGSGDRLDGVFGGAELDVFHTGLSLLVEHDSKTPYAGIRYQSPSIRWLADASVVASLMRSLKSTNGVAERTAFSVGIQIPLGRRFDASRCEGGPCEARLARDAAGPAAAAQATAELGKGEAGELAVASAPRRDSDQASASVATASSMSPAVAWSALAASGRAAAPLAMQRIALAPAAEAGPTSLDAIVDALSAAGLERGRAGIVGRDLVVEYENHRYNQNEADALGIALGVAARHAGSEIDTIRVVIRKADQAIAEVSVDRGVYAAFLAGGSPTAADASLSMRMRPTYAASAIDWSTKTGRHSLVRFEIAPVTRYLYGTDYGNFDYSVGAELRAFVPLWRGAEFYASAIAPIANSRNMDDGRFYSAYRLRGGIADAALAQSFWIAPRVFNVTSVGKFDLQYLGVENETTAFVPGRPDVVRLKLAYLRREPGKDALPDEKSALLSYRWVQPSWKLWIEAGVARYVGGDKGPLLVATRWFDDVAFSFQAQHSGRGSFVGASASFPLTPRQGMKPGLVEIGGTAQFPLNFRTRVGSTNYLSADGGENLDFAYDAQQLLLNQGRFSAAYFATQLYRMRDAYQRYAAPEASNPRPASPTAALDAATPQP
ncbi:YjbH domain-containing protein [Burkholderia gladioli]|uniref:YjbH domain-containing protein n=1 Tax=Burkholderia gladioli TaxID=28095 RepID=UPI00163F04B3|nr:YjbH domain-containing protein [Burkholderia gladioli]